MMAFTVLLTLCILLLCSFHCFLEVFFFLLLIQATFLKSVYGFIFLCIIQEIINHAKTIGLATTKMVLNPNTKMTASTVLYILSVPPLPIFVLGTVAPPGWRTWGIICFHSWLAGNFLVQIATLLFLMVVDPQAARKGKWILLMYFYNFYLSPPNLWQPLIILL